MKPNDAINSVINQEITCYYDEKLLYLQASAMLLCF